MANGDGTYNNPIIVDGLIKKDGKIYKLNTGNTKNCVKSVNNIKPDENGNVVVPELDKVDIENSITEIKKKNAEQDTALSNAKQELSDKCDASLSNAKTYTDEKTNDALTNAKTYTDQEKAKYLPLTGGTVGDTYPDAKDGTGVFALKKVNGGALFLFDTDHFDAKGGVIVRAYIDVKNQLYRDLQIKSDGVFIWNGQNVVRSVNGINADASGNVNAQKITNGTSQTCILYGNGWCLQCGRVFVPSGKNYATVNLLTPFKNNNYYVYCMARDGNEDLTPSIASTNFNSKTTTSFHTISSYYSSTNSTWNESGGWGIDWLALGFVS